MDSKYSHWNLRGLLTWIMYRDIQYADLGHDVDVTASILPLVSENLMTGAPPVTSFESAVQHSLKFLVNGDLHSVGSTSLEEGRTTINPEDWIGLKFQYEPDMAIEDLPSSTLGKRYYNLLFSVQDALKIWGDSDKNLQLSLVYGSTPDDIEHKETAKEKRVRHWRSLADLIRSENPGKKNTWIASKIARGDHSYGLAFDTIRKAIGKNGKK